MLRKSLHAAPLKLDLMALYKYIYYNYNNNNYFLTSVLSSQGIKKIKLCNTKKYKNKAGMNLTLPSPSQNCRAIRWHCTAESK